MIEYRNQILCGNAYETLQQFPDDCVDCIVTSPPYHGLRDYETEGQIGREPTLNEYIEKLLLVTKELKRVLKIGGTLWRTVGFAVCECEGEGVFQHGVVLDPFCGVGTAPLFVKVAGYVFVGIDINEDYASLARKRLAEVDAVQTELRI